jgi:organic radical activating enzyme
VNLVEIFWSVQGEGTEVGIPSVFVRFGECDLRCAWCDSPETWLAAKACRIEQQPGSGVFEAKPNPLSVAEVVEEVERLQAGRRGLVSITGGEPLLQPAAVCELASSLRVRGSRVLLETHGLAVEAVGSAAGVVDVVSMDWKLSSDVRRESDARHGPVADFHDAHEAFLKRALESVTAGATVYVKVVVTASTRDDELREMSERIARVSVETPLILQPVTPAGPVREAPAVEQMFACLRLCQERLADVRLIPQTHKSLGVR